MKVLLIEPNRLLASTVEEFLKADGHDVYWAHNAQGAVTGADTEKPDVVVIELQLAGHSGTEFLYEFRSYPEWQGIPAIIYTGLSRHDVNISDDKLRELGVVKYLYKADTPLESLARQLRVISQSKTAK